MAETGRDFERERMPRAKREALVQLMHRIGSTVLVTTPTYALHMLEVSRELGYDTAASPLRLGIFIGEPGAAIPATRQVLADGWGIQIRDMATTSEMTPWGTNVECSAGNGAHVLQDEVWTEIVDKDDPAKAVPEGGSGGVIYTHLRRDSQPMIRFSSGDESLAVRLVSRTARLIPAVLDPVNELGAAAGQLAGFGIQDVGVTRLLTDEAQALIGAVGGAVGRGRGSNSSS
jgi:phenylacetate-coenzyme A ligase PaaK-like adenylate-forming protein